MGRERIDRSTNPLAAMMDESLEELEREGAIESPEGEDIAEDLAGEVPKTTQTRGAPGPGSAPRAGRASLGRGGRRPGRPKGGRNSDPNMVPISAKIHRDVRFALDRVLAEQSELQGRPVYMAEVIERLLRFYVERGDPYEVLAE
jgi:hypothetical protein